MSRVGQRLRLAGTVAIVVGLASVIYAALLVARVTAPEPLRPREAVNSTALTPPRALRPPFTAGESLGQVSITRLGLRADISEGESTAVLRRGAGHLSDTPWTGQDGNVVLAGHRDTVFRALRKVELGDVIEIATVDGSVHYSVEQMSVVAPDDLTVLEPFGGSTLTLVTCYPFTFIGAAPSRFVVRAREIVGR